MQKTNLWLPKGNGEGGINLEFGINRYTLLYTKQINKKDPLYSTGNYIQYLVIPYNGKESEKGQIDRSIDQQITESLFCIPETNTIRSEERRVGKECRSRWSPYH